MLFIIIALLIIIAVGVLLASEAGQELLGWLINLLVGGVKLLFWLLVVLVVIGLLAFTKMGKDFASTVLGLLGLLTGVLTLGLLIAGGRYLLKKAGLSDKTIRIIAIFLLISISIVPIFLIIYVLGSLMK